MAKSRKIILGVTGSIAAYKAGDIIRRLQDQGLEVKVVMTKEAEKFITPLTLESLCGGKVYRNLFDDENAWRMDHIQVAQDVDMILIAPATANIIGKLANGIADDLLTCMVLATKAKVVVAPAMNVEMYRNKIVQENVAKLKRHGVSFIEPAEGKLACGTIGIGHLAEVDDIVKAAIRELKK